MYWHLYEGSSVQFSHAVMSNSLWPHGHQASLSITNCQSLLKLMSTSRWCHPAISSSVILFSCFQSFPASGSFPVSQFFTSHGQSIGASTSASVISVNIQDRFPLGLTGWISLQSRGLSTPWFKSIISFLISFLYSPTLTFIHDCWINETCDYTDLCQQSNVSAF